MTSNSMRRRRVGLVASTAASFLASVALSADQSAALVVTTPTARKIHSPLDRAQCRAPFQLERPTSSTLTTRSRQTRSNNGRTVCFYADEWLDAGIELAFHTGDTCSAAARPPPHHDAPAVSRLLRRLLHHFSRKWFQLKEQIRTSIERSTVYVLECEGGKYYVGSTTNRKRRFREHARRKGSKWTRRHKPLRVMKEYRRIPSKFLLGMESKITAEYMLKYGVNNVRGSMFCSPRDYHIGDIDALTKFLGHYNDLNYRKVNARLSQTLPVSPSRLRKRASYHAHMAGKCFTCGKEGHYAASCPEKNAVVLAP